jgi:elongator complex protein 1
MRNLKNIRHQVCRTPCDISAVCWDAANDDVLVVHGPTKDDAKISLVRVAERKHAGADASVASSSQLYGIHDSSCHHAKIQSFLLSSPASPANQTTPHNRQCRTVASWEAPSPNPDLAVDQVVSLHYFADTATSCLVLAGGDIVVVQETDDNVGSTLAGDPDDAHVEIVGSIDAGITAARWSPDEELFVITTAADTVVFMSRTFDPITEATLTSEDLKLSKHVSVGWGKKETQFQGKGAKAKALRDPTIPEKVDEGELSSKDDQRTTISWRGDGAYVAVNTIESGRRVIRVYSREGILDSVSEPVDGLEGSLSWRPAGNLLAGIQRQNDNINVVFFERNGLRHGEFALQVPNQSKNSLDEIALEWNSDSTVLAVALQDRIQLWTMGNYHWYLKQEILCVTTKPNITWHPERALSYVAATASKLLVEEYISTVLRGPVTAPNDLGSVVVLDGQTVKFTPYRTANIPPPMAMFDIEVESSVVDVAFAHDGSVMAVLHQAGISVYKCETKGGRSMPPGLLGGATFERSVGVNHEERALQIAFSDAHAVKVLQRLENDLIVASYEINDNGSVDRIQPDLVASSARTIFTSPEGLGGLLIQDHSGGLFQCVDGEMKSLPLRVPVQLPWTEVIEHHGQLLVFGLSRNGHLYANSRQLVKNCTSFLVTSDHLIFTTTNHLLKFVHISDPEGIVLSLSTSGHLRVLTRLAQISMFPLMTPKTMSDAEASSVVRSS